MSGKVLLQRSFGPDEDGRSRTSIELPPGLDNLMSIPPVPPVSHRFGKRRLKKKRNSVVITTSMGKLVAEVPSSPFDEPPEKPSCKSLDWEENEEEEEKEENIVSKALVRFRKFCSTGDVVVRFRFTGKDLSNDTTQCFRFDVLEFVEKRSIYRSEYVSGTPRWKWDFGVFTLKTGTNRVRISISSSNDKAILYQRDIMIGTMKRYFRERCLLELQHVSRPADVRSIEIEEFTVERVGSPLPRQTSPIKTLSQADSHKDTRRKSLGERVVQSVVPRWMKNLASPRNARRWSLTRRRSTLSPERRRRRWSEMFTREESSPNTAERSDFKPSNTNVSVSQFHDLEDFQSKLRQSDTKSEYCGYIKHAQRFFTRHVKLKFVSLDSASVMVKEIKRQKICLNEDTVLAKHNSMSDRLMAIEYVCSTLRSKLREKCIVDEMKEGDDVPIIMWILQCLGENRVGKQVFDALETMTGIDLQKDLNFMLYDMKGNSSFPKETASVNIESNEIEISKIHHMQLCKNQHFELSLHVKSVCKLNLKEKTETFRVEICYDADRPCRKVFEPRTQCMISLHSESQTFDFQAYDKKFNELQSLFLQRAMSDRNNKMRERKGRFFNFL